jgi:hypothetical protein
VRLLVALLLAGGVAHAAPDYAPGSTEWNGLSRLFELAHGAGCHIVAEDELDWSSLKKSDVLWLVYPRALVEPAKLSRFLAGGGRVVIADDFGAAGDALEKSLHLRRGGAPGGADVERFNDNPRLPVARPGSSPLSRAAEELVSNHPASFQRDEYPVAFQFGDGGALVVEKRFQGGGYAVAIADPSIFINNMLELDGNQAFAGALVAATCRAGDKLHLLAPIFVQRGEPPATLEEPADSSTSPARVNDLVGDFNGRARTSLADRRVTLTLGLTVGLLASFLLLGAFPARGLIRDRWTKMGRIADPLLAHPLDQAWDLAVPLAVLRQEALDRLAAALGGPVDFDWVGPTAIAERVRARRGDEAARLAGELWRVLKKVRWRTVEGDPIPDERIGRRQLQRAHALASALFDELERT